MLRVYRHLPHDDHLGFQQHSVNNVAQYRAAVVREGDARLNSVVGWDWVAEGRRRKAKSICDISALIMLWELRWSRASAYVAGELEHESEVFDGVQRI